MPRAVSRFDWPRVLNGWDPVLLKVIADVGGSAMGNVFGTGV